jgi:monoamine oxidase
MVATADDSVIADAIIVGAGASGLMCARELRRAGLQVLVLEASKRVGGRILTLYGTNAGVPVELGAEFIHGDAPETRRLLDEARLVTVPVSGEHYRSDRGEMSFQGSVWKRMALVFRHLNPRRKHDRSFEEFLAGKPGGSRLKQQRELVRGFVQGFNGADTRLISEKSIAQQGDPTEGAAQTARIVNGYAALIEHLRRDAADAIRLNTVVRRVGWNDTDVSVIDQDGTRHIARAVIITVPLPMLQDDSMTIEPEVPALREAARQLVMGHVVRVNVVVKERFWEKRFDALSYVHAPTRPFTVWWTQHPIQAPLITGWAGGPAARALMEGGDIEGAAIAELARAFGLRRSRVEALVDSIHTHDWTRDPSSRGAYSYAGVGGASAPGMLARPMGRTLFLAGEATHTAAGGSVEGALASGKRAAENTLKSLGESHRSTRRG